MAQTDKYYSNGYSDLSGRQTYRQIFKQTERLPDRQSTYRTDRQTTYQTDRQTGR